MKLKLKEYENPYWTDSYTLEATNQIEVSMDNLISTLASKKDQFYFLSEIVGKVNGLCDDYGIDYDLLLKNYNEIEDWSNSDSTLEEDYALEEVSEGEEATQPEDIPKKEEYKKMVIPNFKVGKKIEESEGLDMLNEDDINKAFEIFDEVMTSKGYKVWFSDEDGYHATAYKNGDDYSCIFSLNVWRYPKEVSLFVEDRNGNFYLGGNTAAIYTVGIQNHIDSEVENRIKIMIETALKNYGDYGINNRLDFAAKKINEERQSF